MVKVTRTSELSDAKQNLVARLVVMNASVFGSTQLHTLANNMVSVT